MVFGLGIVLPMVYVAVRSSEEPLDPAVKSPICSCTPNKIPFSIKVEPLSECGQLIIPQNKRKYKAHFMSHKKKFVFGPNVG